MKIDEVVNAEGKILFLSLKLNDYKKLLKHQALYLDESGRVLEANFRSDPTVYTPSTEPLEQEVLEAQEKVDKKSEERDDKTATNEKIAEVFPESTIA